MELHFIRHGQTNWNEEHRVQGQSESELTELGIQQARDLGERIAHLEFDQVFCSSSLRTRQTAEHVFRARDIQIEYLDALREIYLGPWEGHLYDDIAIREPDSHRHFWQQPHLFNLAGAESFFDLQDRAVTTVASISKDFKQKKIAVVSHGALIKSYLCYVQERPIQELWAPPLMHNCSHSIVDISYAPADGGSAGESAGESDTQNNSDRTVKARIVQYADQIIGEEKI
ncbi:MAG: histidine phosphatase family protein [Pseudohongiella sp.]|nr:histidine phosphatase family protein [Pseudohongiella sp.]